ncbi:MAG: hypothetical protein HEQ32_08110 [Vampirovibrio sp.]
MKILGIDPGLGRIGFGLIDVSTPQSPLALGWGVVETTPKSPIGKRLVEIHHDIQALIRDLRYILRTSDMRAWCKRKG